MKISKLYIDEYKHLKDLDFDFTYPMDFHDETKRGKPLDKICFIGQSGTGKTKLLELIYEYILNTLNLELIDGKHTTDFRNPIKSLNGEVSFLFNQKSFIQKGKQIFYNNKQYKPTRDGGIVTPLIYHSERRPIYYFKSDLVSQKNISILNKHPLELIEKFRDENFNTYPEVYEGVIFSDEIDEKIWYSLLEEILDFRKKFYQKATELIGKGVISDLNKFNENIKKFYEENPNPLIQFAEKFDKILTKLNLKVEIHNTEFSIPIENLLTGEIIPINDTSTGTKGLLLSFLPLFKVNTKESIILIDEPERSLFPDIQMDLMEYYENLAPEAQFIIATHSPFIAASFEPCERFILYFDAEGKVAIRPGTSPIGDDPNDILKNDFELEFLMNEKGRKAFERFRELKKKIATVDDEEEKDKLLDEILTLAKTYKF